MNRTQVDYVMLDACNLFASISTSFNYDSHIQPDELTMEHYRGACNFLWNKVNYHFNVDHYNEDKKSTITEAMLLCKEIKWAVECLPNFVFPARVFSRICHAPTIIGIEFKIGGKGHITDDDELVMTKEMVFSEDKNSYEYMEDLRKQES